MRRMLAMVLILVLCSTVTAAKIDYVQSGVNMAWFGPANPPFKGQSFPYELDFSLNTNSGKIMAKLDIPAGPVADPKPPFKLTEVVPQPDANTRHFQTDDGLLTVFWLGNDGMIDQAIDTQSFVDHVEIVGFNWCQPEFDTSVPCDGGFLNASTIMPLLDVKGSHAPEPSAVVLAMLGVLSAFHMRKRR